MEELDAATSVISARIRVAFEQAARHGVGNTDKVAELLITKLESDDVLLMLIARVWLRDVLCAVVEGLTMLSSLDAPRHPDMPPIR